MNAYLLVGIGLVALVVGAEALVRGGSAVAAKLGISPMIVGMTVVSIGTSLPELAVGIDAARANAGPLAVGNIVGTNMVNILLILGLSAAMVPLTLQRRTVRVDLPTMIFCAVLVWLLAWGGALSRLDGLVLFAVAVVYTVAAVRREIVTRRPDLPAPEVDGAGDGPMWWHLTRLLAGIVIVLVGAEWLVDGSVRVAVDLRVSEAVIGLTVVAIGTSAPELVTTIVSTMRGDRELAVGNLIGSSIYNVALILGVTALVKPIEVTLSLLRIDMPLMIVMTLILIPVFMTGQRISRLEGIFFVAAYGGYLALVLELQT